MLVPSHNVLNGLVFVGIIMAWDRARSTCPYGTRELREGTKKQGIDRLTIRPVDTMFVSECNRFHCVGKQIPLTPFSKGGIGMDVFSKGGIGVVFFQIWDSSSPSLRKRDSGRFDFLNLYSCISCLPER